MSEEYRMLRTVDIIVRDDQNRAEEKGGDIIESIGSLLRISGKSLTTLDNRAKVGVAMLLVEAGKLDGMCMVTPGRLYQAQLSEVTPPNIMQLPSLLGLRTIKAGKRMDNLIAKLKKIREDYLKAVEEEKDES